MSVVAKFKCTRISHNESYVEVVLVPVYSSDPTSENYSWSKYTPSGEIKMNITNPAASKQFELSKSYIINFTEEQ